MIFCCGRALRFADVGRAAARARRCWRWCCRGSSTRSPSRASWCSSSTTSTGSSSAASRESVAWFVDHMPATVQLVLSTRADPALPLGALRAHGQLLELRADDLRFTRGEADEFLNGRLGLDLAAADVELLVARTEGWPAGIYLAALSLAGKADKPALVRAFDGTSAHVVDFLSSEVLGAYEPELQAFMLRTSVLERLCVPLCDAVLGGDGSAAALESLARSNLFLLPLDDQRRWFRFHHLFAQLLRVELERREPELVPGLHRRAYEWHDDVRHDRRGDPPRPRGARVRRGGRADRRDLGPLRQRRPHVLGARLAAAVPRGGPRRRRAPAARQGLDLRAARRRGRHARGAGAPAPARRAGRRPAPGRLRLARVERLRAERGVRVGGRRGVARGRARARPRSRGPTRPGARWSRGRSAGATTATASSTSPSGGCARRPRSRPAADQWIVGTGAIADLSLIARHARATGTSSCAWRPRPWSRRASTGCSRRARSARCTRRTASRSARTAAARRRCPRSSRACSCGGCGGSRSTSSTG